MLLARKGHRVLLVDRATFPSDTVPTHLVQPLGVAALARWGLSIAWSPPGARRSTPSSTTSVRSRSKGRRGRRNVEGSYLATVGLAPAFAQRLARARREARFAGHPF